jgi:hypothetical protein
LDRATITTLSQLLSPSLATPSGRVVRLLVLGTHDSCSLISFLSLKKEI